MIRFLSWLLSMCWHNGSHWLFRWWIWDMILATSLTQLRLWGTEHWEHKTVFLWSQRAPWLHSAELQLTLTLSYWDQSGAGHELSIMRTPVIVTVRILQRMTEVLCQCHVSGSPFNPTLGPDLSEAGAWDPLLTAAEVPGLAEAPWPRLPSPPASIEDTDLSILASKTRPFALPAKDK